jgi:hypothetical protein
MSAPVLRRPRSDALPENTDFKDTGCELAPSCLRCPFEVCRFDPVGETGKYQGHVIQAKKLDKRRARVDELLGSGLVGREVAAALSISLRTVYRDSEAMYRNQSSPARGA